MGLFGVGCLYFPEHLLDGRFNLKIPSLNQAFGIVTYHYVRIELLVFLILALIVLHADLRYSENEGRVYLAFPPYCRHRARHRHAYDLADSKGTVCKRESVGIRIVAFTHNDTGRFVPLFKGSEPIYCPLGVMSA